MVSTRSSSSRGDNVSMASASSSDDEGSSSASSTSSSSSTYSSSTNNHQQGVESSSSSSSSSSRRSCKRSFRSSRSSIIMTRKRRLVHEAEEHLAIGVAPYWEGTVDAGDWHNREETSKGSSTQSGKPRRSHRGEARRRYEGVAGPIREHGKMAVTLPPMVSTREGKLLAVEVFGGSVLEHLPAIDKGPRVGHCSSGYVCGHPVPRGKEGNLWCQTPVRASRESKMACQHHLYRRIGAGGASQKQLRYMLLADEFYEQAGGDLCWRRVVSHLRSGQSSFPFERRRRRQVLAAGGRALAVSDAKIVLHGFEQCTLFWLAACRLTRRGYLFTVVAHASKTEFKDFLTDLRAKAAVPPPSQPSSPFVCVNDMYSANVCYYASGYDQVYRMF